MARTTKEPVADEVEPELDEAGAVDAEADDAAPEDLVDIEDGIESDLGDDEEVEDDDGEPPAEDAEALDELEAEELDMLTDDEASEVIAVDEAEELRIIRREQMAMESDAEGAGSDEFVCQSCFLVKRTSQLAGPKSKICRDCAA